MSKTVITPEQIARQFITQFKKKQLGILFGTEGVFNREQLIGMVNTIQNNPTEMITFFDHVIAVIPMILIDEDKCGEDEVIQALMEFTALLTSILIPLASMPDSIRLENFPDVSQDEILDGLDFNMPNWNDDLTGI